MSETQREKGDSNTNDANTNASSIKRKRKNMKSRSEVWDHFTKYVDAEGFKRAKCNYCEKPCGKLDMDAKSYLISETLPKKFKNGLLPLITYFGAILFASGVYL